MGSGPLVEFSSIHRDLRYTYELRSTSGGRYKKIGVNIHTKRNGEREEREEILILVTSLVRVYQWFA